MGDSVKSVLADAGISVESVDDDGYWVIVKDSRKLKKAESDIFEHGWVIASSDKGDYAVLHPEDRKPDDSVLNTIFEEDDSGFLSGLF